MEKYFVTKMSPDLLSLDYGYGYGQILTSDEEKYLEERARTELGSEISFVTERRLYKLVKRRKRGVDTEIILSPAVGGLLDQIRDDYPKAVVWIYEL